jgi:hypothetical protein
MTDTSASRVHLHGKRKHDTSTYRQRLKAAGLDDGNKPDDMDEFRHRIARSIAMFLNEWHGCPEPLCQRHRGCMTPNCVCTNIPQPSDEEVARDWPLVKFEIYKALKQELAARGVDVGRYVGRDVGKCVDKDVNKHVSKCINLENK